jgi:protein TonB
MNKIIALLLVCSLSIPVMSQSTQDTSQGTQPSDPNDKTFPKVEQYAEYSGGWKEWEKFIDKNLKYPYVAEKNEIQGVVVIQFVVNRDGSVSDVIAISGPAELRAEGVRIIQKSSGKWIPAKAGGLPVRSNKKQPLVFKLQRN